MSKINDFINALELPVDATYRCDCPVCHGRNTFTVSNDNGNILYNCYKNSCKIAGAYHKNMDVFTIKNMISAGGRTGNSSEAYTEVLQQAFDLPPYLTTTITDYSQHVRDFCDKWGIYPDHVMYDVRQERVVFPVKHNGVIVDAVGRALTKRQPKWLRYASSPVPYMWGDGDVMVVVEDAISAYVLGEMFGVVGVALLGTQLTDFHKWYFSTYYKHNKFIIALDYDAFNKTISLAKQLRVTIDDVSALMIKKDFKYRNSEDLTKLQEMING
jgi:hypothetical protein